MIMRSLLILFLIPAFFSFQKGFLSSKNDSYLDAIKLIDQAVSTDPSLYHSAYKRTAYLVDTYGPRLWGSEVLEIAKQDFFNQVVDSGLDDARLDPIIDIPQWIRGKEKLTLYSPRPFPQVIPLIGLGLTVSGNVKAESIVFRSFDEMTLNSSKVKDKIVIFNQGWYNYSHDVNYRIQCPIKVAQLGGLACIIRSVASFSIESPHTGMTFYANDTKAIPSAAISVESAEMFSRMQERGQKIILHLELEGHYGENRNSSNVIAELKGHTYPQEVLVLGGHIDTWDVGPQTGANDDTAGFMVCFEAIRTLAKLGLRPKRTIRFVAWSGEEMGKPNSGAREYFKKYINDMENHVIGFESDEGTKKLLGFGYSGGSKGLSILKEISQKYLKQIGADLVHDNDGEMTDTSPLHTAGVPVIRNIVDDNLTNDYYFTYHHSAGDTVDILDADDMDSNVKGIASLFYILADMNERFPRD